MGLWERVQGASFATERAPAPSFTRRPIPLWREAECPLGDPRWSVLGIDVTGSLSAPHLGGETIHRVWRIKTGLTVCDPSDFHQREPVDNSPQART
jgi:hypothetical protein